MESGGIVQRGKIKRDTLLCFIISFLWTSVVGLLLTIGAIQSPYASNKCFLGFFGIISLVVGSGETVAFWYEMRQELYPPQSSTPPESLP